MATPSCMRLLRVEHASSDHQNLAGSDIVFGQNVSSAWYSTFCMLHWNYDGFINLENGRGKSCLIRHTSRTYYYSKTLLFFTSSLPLLHFQTLQFGPLSPICQEVFAIFFSTKFTTKRQAKKSCSLFKLAPTIYIYFPNIDHSQISKGALLDILNPVQLHSLITFKQLSSNKFLINSHQINSKRSFLLPYASQHSTAHSSSHLATGVNLTFSMGIKQTLDHFGELRSGISK